MTATLDSLAVDSVQAYAYTIPTESPESDGTIEWHSTTIVIAEISAGDRTGLGYTYASPVVRDLVMKMLAEVVVGRPAMDVTAAWIAVSRAVRNVGRRGIAASAIAVLDVALWDLKAKLLDQPLAVLLGRSRDAIAAYGSGGFTSYSMSELRDQLGGWAADGLRAVKMKVGREPDKDPERVEAARASIGPGVELFVDANGAYERKQALGLAERFSALDVTWFDEPVSSDDVDGLRLIRDRAPAPMRIAAGEYAYDGYAFRRLLENGAVDVLQADATRCGGVSGFLRAAALCEAHNLPLSAHTAPSLHTHLCCAVPPAINVEYFHDHACIERMLFDGAREPKRGFLVPDTARAGLGLKLKRSDAERFAV